MLAWHIDHGQFGEINLDGFNTAVVTVRCFAQPSPVESLGQHHRHTMVNCPHQRVRFRGEERANRSHSPEVGSCQFSQPPFRDTLKACKSQKVCEKPVQWGKTCSQIKAFIP
jgi:hypothetical protein